MAAPTIHQVLVDYEDALACCIWHAWWPGVADPFYQHNPVPVEQRVDYYGITWVPDLMINGVGAGYPGGPDPEDYTSMATFIDSCMAVPSPLVIDCSGLIENGVNLSVDVTVQTPQAPGAYRLFVALVEEHIDLPSPNGETEHYHTFRWINGENTASGEPIDLGGIGTQRFDYTFPYFESVYQIHQMAVTAWVQDDATMEVLQAGKAAVPAPYYVAARHVGLDVQIGGAAEPVEFASEVENLGAYGDVYDVSVTAVPGGWAYAYTTPEGTFSGPSTLPLGSGEIAPIMLTLDSQGNPGSATVELHIASQASPEVTAALEFTKMNGMQVLLVDDDGGANREEFIEPALNAAGSTWGTWHLTDGELTGTDLRNAAESVFWICGIGTEVATLTPNDRAALAAFLDDGGRLVISGSDISYDLGDPASPHHTPEAQLWLETYLHAVHLTDWSLSWLIDGTPGDPIGDNLDHVQLTGVGDNAAGTPDGIEPGPGAGLIFTYVGVIAQGDAGIRWEEGSTRVVFFAFAIESIESEPTRNLVVDRVLDWLSGTTAIEGLPCPGPAAHLLQSAPNPFAEATLIRYGLDGPGPVSLRIYDVSGRAVRTLVSEYQEAAPRSIVWDGISDSGHPVATGVYFYRLEAPGVIESRHLTLRR